MAVCACDEDSSVTSGFDTFYAHGGNGDGHVGVVESEGAVGRGCVYAKEEEGGGGAEGEEVGYCGEEDSWTGWD